MEGWVDLGYPAMHRPGVELATCRSRVRRLPLHHRATQNKPMWAIQPLGLLSPDNYFELLNLFKVVIIAPDSTKLNWVWTCSEICNWVNLSPVELSWVGSYDQDLIHTTLFNDSSLQVSNLIIDVARWQQTEQSTLAQHHYSSFNYLLIISLVILYFCNIFLTKNYSSSQCNK